MNISALQALSLKVPPYPPADGQPEVESIRAFARINGFQYYLKKPELIAYSWHDYKITPAWLGIAGIGAGKDAYNVVNGDYKGFPFWMFQMWDNLVDGDSYENPTTEQEAKFTKQQTTGIVRIQLPKVFPQVVLDSNKNDHIRSSVKTEYEKSQRLSLEGDFDDFFDLYAPISLQINVLSLLAPNLMQILKNYAGVFDLEFNGREMILMTNATLYDPTVMQALIDALDEQLPYMSNLLASWSYTPQVQPTDYLKKTLVAGRILKVGKWRISALTQVAAVMVAFLLFGILILLLR